MANQLQDIMYPNSLQVSGAVDQAYNNSFTNALGQVSKLREEELAQFRQPEYKLGSTLTQMETANKIRTAPDRFAIEDTNRWKEARVADLTKLAGALSDETLGPEERKFIVDTHIDRYKEEEKRKAVAKSGISGLQGATDPALKERIAQIDSSYERARQVAMGNPTQFMKQIQDSLKYYTMGAKDIQAQELEATKITGNVMNTDQGYRPWEPKERSGGSGEKLASDVRKYIDDQRKLVYGDATLKAKLSELGFILDELGNIKPDPNKAPNADHKTKAEALRDAAKAEFARRSENARIRYYELTGIRPDEFVQPTSTSTSSTPQTTVTPTATHVWTPSGVVKK